MNHAQLLVPDFSLIACGWLLCRYTALDRRVWDQVESLVYYFLFPVLLFHSIVRSPIDFGTTSHLLAAGVGIGLAGIALAYALPFLPAIGHRIDRRDHAASVQIAFRFNSFICLTMAERLAGAEGLLMIAVLIGVCVPLMNVAAVWPMARHGQSGFLRQLARNPLIIATATGLVANLLGLRIPGEIPSTRLFAPTSPVNGLPNGWTSRARDPKDITASSPASSSVSAWLMTQSASSASSDEW